MMASTQRAVLQAVVVCLCAATLACDWPWRHDMADQPSPAASQGPRSPATGASPLVARGQGDARGQELYEIYCLPCHGATGSGRDAAVAGYFPRVGDLGGADVQARTDDALFTIITSGTPIMPAYAHELDVGERRAIVRFLRTLAR